MAVLHTRNVLPANLRCMRKHESGTFFCPVVREGSASVVWTTPHRRAHLCTDEQCWSVPQPAPATLQNNWKQHCCTGEDRRRGRDLDDRNPNHYLENPPEPASGSRCAAAL